MGVQLTAYPLPSSLSRETRKCHHPSQDFPREYHLHKAVPVQTQITLSQILGIHCINVY